MSLFGARHLPRAPLPIEGVIFSGAASSTASAGITRPTSLLQAHAPVQIPHADFSFLYTACLCRLLRAPAGRWTFPALFRESFPRCLDPYPGDSHWCTYPFLPRGQRPSPRREWLGTQHYVRTATSVREISRGYSHLLMFRPPGLLATQVAPAVVCQLSPTHQAAVAFTFTPISVCYLSEQ